MGSHLYLMRSLPGAGGPASQPGALNHGHVNGRDRAGQELVVKEFAAYQAVLNAAL